MLCGPTESEDVVNVAEPLLSVTGEPRFTPPSMNWMVPVAVPDPGATAETVAVKVTAWPKIEGFVFEVTDVLLADWFTISASDDAVLPLKFASPL